MCKMCYVFMCRCYGILDLGQLFSHAINNTGVEIHYVFKQNNDLFFNNDMCRYDKLIEDIINLYYMIVIKSVLYQMH